MRLFKKNFESPKEKSPAPAIDWRSLTHGQVAERLAQNPSNSALAQSFLRSNGGGIPDDVLQDLRQRNKTAHQTLVEASRALYEEYLHIRATELLALARPIPWGNLQDDTTLVIFQVAASTTDPRLPDLLTECRRQLGDYFSQSILPLLPPNIQAVAQAPSYEAKLPKPLETDTLPHWDTLSPTEIAHIFNTAPESEIPNLLNDYLGSERDFDHFMISCIDAKQWQNVISPLRTNFFLALEERRKAERQNPSFVIALLNRYAQEKTADQLRLNLIGYLRAVDERRFVNVSGMSGLDTAVQEILRALREKSQASVAPQRPGPAEIHKSTMPEPSPNPMSAEQVTQRVDHACATINNDQYRRDSVTGLARTLLTNGHLLYSGLSGKVHGDSNDFGTMEIFQDTQFQGISLDQAGFIRHAADYLKEKSLPFPNSSKYSRPLTFIPIQEGSDWVLCAYPPATYIKDAHGRPIDGGATLFFSYPSISPRFSQYNVYFADTSGRTSPRSATCQFRP